MVTEQVAFHIDEEQVDYLSEWMQKVSRSFALVVPFVEEPLTHYLATAYLLCRVADNIEDCSQPIEWKQARFAELGALLDEPGQAASVLSSWADLEWPGLTGDERAIMQPEHGIPLWDIYANFPQSSRDIVRRWVQAMAGGMAQLGDTGDQPHFVSRQGIQILGDEADYNGYCYIVAGTVGYMSTELVIEHYGVDEEAAGRLRATAEACGRGLQKTNIVKDFAKDLARGVCYLPESWMREASYTPLALEGAPGKWSQHVIGNVLDELGDATKYLVALPYAAEGYRMASLLCLLPAYETLLLAAQKGQELFTAEHQVKISRQAMGQCLEDGQRLLHDNDAISAYSQEMDTRIRDVLRERVGTETTFGPNGSDRSNGYS
ncbi:MAG: squalene/phytoene synthase family protein [Caldilineaceae bacterium]